jgi:Flp pilus assembly pilin Flp
VGRISIGISRLDVLCNLLGQRKGTFVMVQNMLVVARAMLNDRKGISALEYAILAAGILGVIATAVGTLTAPINNLFAKVVSDLS